MKKSFTTTILSSALALGLSGIPTMPVSAAYIEPTSGAKIYTLEEMADLEAETLTKLELFCGDDLACQGETLSGVAMRNSYYQLMLLYMEGTSFMITSVNLSEKTMTVRFRPGYTTARWYDSVPEGNLVNFLRLGWSEPGYPMALSTMYRLPVDESEAPAGFHFLYNGTITDHEGEWFTEIDKEYTITLPESGFTNGESDIVQFHFDMPTGNTVGGFSISSCINSPYYAPGMECRLTFLEDYGQYYVPYVNGRPAFVSEEEATSTPGTSTSEGTTSESTTTPGDTTHQDTTPENTAPNETPETGYGGSSESSAGPTTFNQASAQQNTVALATNSATAEDSVSSENITAAEDSATENETSDTESSNNLFIPSLSGEEATPNSQDEFSFPWWILVVLLCSGIVISYFGTKNHKKI